jgi:GT2 family glycosyltransferase
VSLISPDRVVRWLRYDGWSGSVRRIFQYARYWHFRWLVSSLRRRPAQPVTTGNDFGAHSTLITIVLVAFRTEAHWLRQAVDSVRTQDFRDWELCIGFCEVDPLLREEMSEIAQSDKRIRLLDLGENLGIAANTNKTAEGAAGEFLAVLDHDDYLEPGALREVAALARTAPFDLIYTDEHIVTPRGVPLLPILKPDWAPESLLSFNYICHFCCFRASLFREIGGFHLGFEGAQDYDLFLRLSEKASRIGHVPKVLYNWRRHAASTSGGGGAKPAAWEAGRRAVEAHLQRMGKHASVELGTHFGTVSVQPRLSVFPSVEIVLTNGRSEAEYHLCIDNLRRLTRYPDFSIRTENRTKFENQKVVTESDVLVFLDTRVQVLQENWLEFMVAHVLQPGIGAVGPLLISPAGRIEHAGLAVDPKLIFLDYHKFLPAHSGGYAYRVATVQNVTAVGPLCLCTRRAIFERLGGFDSELPPPFAAVDYCLKLAGAGFRNLYTPQVRAGYSETKDHKEIPHIALQRAREKMRAKWGAHGLRERYFDSRLLRLGTGLRQLASEYLSTRE